VGRLGSGDALETAGARRIQVAAGDRRRDSSAQLAVLIDGMDWSRLHERRVARPSATS